MNLKVKGKDRKGNYTGQISVMVNVFSDLQVGIMLLVIDDVCFFLICYWCMHSFLNHSLIKLSEN